MRQRDALRLALTMVTVVAAGACAVSGNLWIAGALVVAALITAVAPFCKPASPDAVRALLDGLRGAQQTGATAPSAVVTTQFIFVANSAFSDLPNRGCTLLFREEIDDPMWRELATRLRHPVHPSPERLKVDRSVTSRLGKSSDL